MNCGRPISSSGRTQAEEEEENNQYRQIMYKYINLLTHNIVIKINNENLQRVTSYKYLGITYDYNLKWDIHISNIVNRLKYLVYVFYRLTPILSKKQLLKLYYGLFHSIAVYAIIGWGGLYNTTAEPLIRLQHRILKIIGITDQDPDKPLEIKQVYVVNSIVQHYSNLKNQYNQHPINTRNKSLEIPKNSLTKGKRSHKFYAIKYFNELPNNIKSLNVNKKLLKKKVKLVIKAKVIE